MFSADAKDEIARVRFERDCCAAHLLRALAAFSTGPLKRSRPSTLIVRTERGATARAALRAAKLAGVPAHAIQRAGTRFHDGHTITVSCDAQFGAVPRPPTRNCCRRAWLRGAFLACGSVTAPARGYHLEFFCRTDLAARGLTEALTDVRVDAGISRRRRRPLVYVKGAQAVADVLAQMGASHAVLALDDVRARRETKNSIRRAVNSEAANAARSGKASARQREAAMMLLHGARLRMLSAPLKEAARLRVAFPDLTLAELAARSRPAITKAAMGYRLRTLERRAHRGPAAPDGRLKSTAATRGIRRMQVRRGPRG